MIVGVVPAAGHATRLGPLPCSKEVLPVGGRPVLEYVVARMRVAADEIRVVTRPEKHDVHEHARRLGATVVQGRPATLAESVRLGIGSIESEAVTLLGFPDSIWEPADGFATLVAALDDDTDVVLGCFRSRELERSDVVVLDGDRVVCVHVKPPDPPSDVMWGCCAARVAALVGLDRYDEPGHLFDALARGGRVRGVRFETEFVDIGTPEALARVLRRRLGGADHQGAQALPVRPSAEAPLAVPTRGRAGLARASVRSIGRHAGIAPTTPGPDA